MNRPGENIDYYSAHIVRYEWNTLKDKFISLQKRLEALIQKDPLPIRHFFEKKTREHLDAVYQEIDMVKFLSDAKAVELRYVTKKQLEYVHEFYQTVEKFVTKDEAMYPSMEKATIDDKFHEIDEEVTELYNAHTKLSEENKTLKEEKKQVDEKLDQERERYRELVASIWNNEKELLKKKMNEELIEWKLLQAAMEGDANREELQEHVAINIFRIEEALAAPDYELFKRVGEFTSARHITQKTYVELLQKEHSMAEDMKLNAISFEQIIAPDIHQAEEGKQENMPEFDDDFETLREAQNAPGFFSRAKESFKERISVIKKMRTKPAMALMLAVATAGIISVSTANTSAKKTVENNTLPSEIKSQLLVKSQLPPKPEVKPQENIKQVVEKVPSQRKLQGEALHAVNTHPLAHASIGSYASDGTVYAGHWTVDTLMRKNPSLDRIINMNGGASSIKPVGYFQTKEGIKKVEGQTYANGHMGVTSSWGAVPMTFALEVTFNNGETSHIGIGTMLKPISQESIVASSDLQQSFTPPTITNKIIPNAQVEIERKMQQSIDHVKEQKIAQEAPKSLLGKFTSGIKNKISRFFS